MRGEVRRLGNPSWLDSSIAALGAAAVCAAFAFHAVLSTAGGTRLAVVTNLAYPIGDLLLLSLVVGGTVMLAGRKRLPWLLLAGGMVLNTVGDTFNLFSSTAGATHVGTVFNNFAWPASIFMICVAMWLAPGAADPLAQPRPPASRFPVSPPWPHSSSWSLGAFATRDRWRSGWPRPRSSSPGCA